MYIKLTLFISIFLLTLNNSYAQKLTIGIENGINYSNLRKKLDYERFAAQQGPVNGIFAKYQLGNYFVLQSGINHTTYHFNERQYYYYDYYWLCSSSYYDPSLSSSYVPVYSSSFAPNSYSNVSTKYSFLRIPLLIKFRTPGKINFEIGGGPYYAFLTNDEYRGKDKDRYDEEYRDDHFPKMNDWGWILETSVNYNISQRWSIFASGRLSSGHEEYFENVEGKMGSTELSFGIGYKPFANKKALATNDSLGQNITILPHSGLNISRTKSKDNKSQYSSSVGFSSGISIKFGFDKNAGILTGAWYERKGYGLNYRGYYNGFYQLPVQEDRENAPLIESEVQLDYVTIPFLFDVSFGNKFSSSLNFGSYFSLLQNAFAVGERIEKYSYDQGFQVQKDYFNQSLDEWYKKGDFGFILGYRIDFQVFKWANTFVGLNQSFGVTNILNDDIENNWSVDNEEMHNNSTSILFGFTIPVNKN